MVEPEPYDGEYLDLAIFFLLMIPVAGVLCLVAPSAPGRKGPLIFGSVAPSYSQVRTS